MALAQSPAHQELLATAQRVLPGGSNGNVVLPPEQAFVITAGQGTRVYDVEGHCWIDYLLGSGPMSADAAVVTHSEAVSRIGILHVLCKPSPGFKPASTSWPPRPGVPLPNGRILPCAPNIPTPAMFALSRVCNPTLAPRSRRVTGS